MASDIVQANALGRRFDNVILGLDVPRESGIRWESRSPMEMDNFKGKGHAPTCQTTL